MAKLNLPDEFVNRMKDILKDQFDEFIKIYEAESYKGFRVNTTKISIDEFLKRFSISFEPVPWCYDGFYINEEVRLSKHPYYFAGLLYIQEPSAMYAVEALQPKNGDRVLDLCASPGGKTIQIASRIGTEGILVSNDAKDGRIRALVKNVENLGLSNIIVLNQRPKEIADSYGCYFDKILVDAPCSGEGMFRKDTSTLKRWKNENVYRFVEIQRSIMTEIDKLLKAGGEVVYSTCTFSPDENEGIIDWFLKKHRNYEVVEIKKYEGFSEGIEINKNDQLKKAVRIYPHLVKGEGHFVCKLKKLYDIKMTNPFEEYCSNVEADDIKIFENFKERYLNIDIERFGKRVFYKKANKLYLGFDGPFGRFTPIRNGIQLGEIYKGRFYPSAHLIACLKCDEIKNVINFNLSDERLYRYLRGETIENLEKVAGFIGICVDNFSLGWGKAEGYYIKNYFPKGWRLE